jgi:hypothetical protein
MYRSNDILHLDLRCILLVYKPFESGQILFGHPLTEFCKKK